MSERNTVYYVDRHRSFVVINDGPLDFDPVTSKDLATVTIDPGIPWRSWVWSSGLQWYFVIGPRWIALFNIHCMTGIICRKKSAELIRLFLDDRAKLCDMVPGLRWLARESA